jgi:hypothetical protein
MNPIVIPLAGIALPLFLVPTILVLKHHQRKREWEHLERLKALEMGQPLPGTDAWPAAAAIAIGAGMPVGVFFAAWMACLTAGAESVVFVPAMFVGLAGVGGGVMTMTRLLGSRRTPKTPEHLANGKPEFDPDAYDVVGRRG